MRKVVFTALLLIPAGAHAQDRVRCDLVSSRQFQSVAQGAVTYIGLPVFNCTNGSVISADSAVQVASTGRADFIGNVHFTEPDRSLTAQNAQYITRERRLQAQGNVVLTDKRDGSVLRAPSLDYFQKGGSNPEDRIEIYSGRPHATLYHKQENSNAIDTTNVDADAMTIAGQQKFRGRGNVIVKRGKLNTRSSYAEFDQNANNMHLHGSALIDSDTFRLAADTVDATLENGDKFKSVRASRDAKLTSNEVAVTAPRIVIAFNEGEVERMVAVGGKRIAASAAQATSTSKDVDFTADSIDAVSPKQKLEEVIGVGNARGTRTPDSLDAKLPALIAKDWVQGDTVHAFFGQAPKDTTRVLQRLVAKGQPASSTYKFREQVNKDSTRLSINYLTAKHIDVTFKGNDVDQVKAEGDIRGMYLEPAEAARKNGGKTASRK